MHIYAIGDLHLSHLVDKPMDIFGERWQNHTQRLSDAWRQTVTDEDLVLVPGDISWAMQPCDALPDLAFIGALPGRKLLLKGNHDYWWSSLTRVRAALAPNTQAIQNDAVTFGEWTIGGTRGWLCPNSANFRESDQKVFLRELQRLTLSISAMEQGKRRLIMMHFPPFTEKGGGSAFTQIIEANAIEQVVYAHLHGAACRNAFEGDCRGVQYTCVSADHVGFAPRRIV